jgi:hypothetical protein
VPLIPSDKSKICPLPQHGRTALHLAKTGATAALLLEGKADMNARNAVRCRSKLCAFLEQVRCEMRPRVVQEGATPLHCMAADGSAEVVHILMEAFAEINATDQVPYVQISLYDKSYLVLIRTDVLLTERSVMARLWVFLNMHALLSNRDLFTMLPLSCLLPNWY